MNILQTIWNAVSTPNEILINVSGFFLCFIEAFVYMKLFTTLLNIDASKRNKILYIASIAIIGFISRILIPNPYGTFLNIILSILLIKFIFNTTFLKSIFAEFIPIFITSVLELIYFRFYLNVFNISYDDILNIPIHRFLCSISIYILLFLLYKLIKYIKFNINLDILNGKSKILFIVTAILGLCVIACQLYLTSFYSDVIPVLITVVSIISLLGYFFISVYSLLSTTRLATTKRDLQVEQWHNKSLKIMHENIRIFKHDFNNIIQSIGGYVDKNDIEGLRKYYKDLLIDCKIVTSLTTLDPNVINNPAIYNILSSKYHKASDLNILVNIEAFLNLDEIEENMRIYDFTKIFGILLDNAIEASLECDKKEINIYFRKEVKMNRLLIIIENTYKNKDVNLDKIYEKNYTSKTDNKNHGFGLFEVRKILKKYDNLNLFTTKDDEYFKQQFEIYIN